MYTDLRAARIAVERLRNEYELVANVEVIIITCGGIHASFGWEVVVGFPSDGLGPLDTWPATLTRVRHERDELRDALNEYGTHGTVCPATPGWEHPGACNCGLAKALGEEDDDDRETEA